MAEFIGFALSFLVLAFSGRILVRSLSNIAHFLRISDYAASFILMGFATSIPEFFVALSSGINGTPVLSFGNIIGANILNVTLLLGIIALISGGIANRDQSIKTDAWIIFVIAAMPLFLIFDGNLDRPDGLILILLYFWYFERLVARQKILGRALSYFNGNFRGARWIFKEAGFFILGIILLLAASGFIVKESQELAKTLDLNLGIFGILIVALGTTVPELTFGLRSVLHKHEQMTLGNAIGSIAVNSTLILGLLALISPFSIEFSLNLKLSIAVLIISLWLFNIFLTNDRPKITRKEGLVLLIVYFVFVIISWFFV